MARKMLALNPNASLEKRKDYVRPRVKQDRPAYGVINNGFFDQYNKFWNPGEALYFDSEPSLNMVPLNEMAHMQLQILYDKLNALGAKKAEKEKHDFTPMILAPWSEDDLSEDFPTPDFVMGYQPDGENAAIR